MHIHILFWDEVGTILCHPPSILSELGPFWEEERDFGTTLGRDFFWDQFGIILGRFRNHTFFPNWSQVFHCSEGVSCRMSLGGLTRYRRCSLLARSCCMLQLSSFQFSVCVVLLGWRCQGTIELTDYLRRVNRFTVLLLIRRIEN